MSLREISLGIRAYYYSRQRQGAGDRVTRQSERSPSVQRPYVRLVSLIPDVTLKERCKIKKIMPDRFKSENT